jgi:hypothetical protein
MRTKTYLFFMPAWSWPWPDKFLFDFMIYSSKLIGWKENSQTSREATILLYAPAPDPHLQKMTELADRVFCIYEGEKAPVKGRAKMPEDQATLEAYS